MKTVSIGDTHGLAVVDIILEIIDKHDKFIFVGDYVDSYNINDLLIEKNLIDIIGLKKKYPDKIILLWGNHDIQYLLGYKKHGCSGYRLQMQQTLFNIFNTNKKLFQFAYQHNNWIWTHAGIHKEWLKNIFPIKYPTNSDITLSKRLNLAFVQEHTSLFDVGHTRGGMNNVGGPLWCDKKELENGLLDDYNQIVGHNRVKHVQRIHNHNRIINRHMTTVFIDVLENITEGKKKINKTSFYYKEI